MTQRERQLLEWIRENPMISQQELAEKAGITRSSAAVHISSLMKKGYIAGRGYLLRTDPYIVVVGGVNMDIGAVSHAPLVARDSNPGRVTTSLGGVGRTLPITCACWASMFPWSRCWGRTASPKACGRTPLPSAWT